MRRACFAFAFASVASVAGEAQVPEGEIGAAITAVKAVRDLFPAGRTIMLRSATSEIPAAVASSVGATLVALEDARECSGRTSDTCRIKGDVKVVLEIIEVAMSDSPVRVEIAVHYPTGFDVRPVGLKWYRVTLVREGPAWRVIDKQLRLLG